MDENWDAQTYVLQTLISILFLSCSAIVELKQAQVYIKQAATDFSVSESTVLVYIRRY